VSRYRFSSDATVIGAGAETPASSASLYASVAVGAAGVAEIHRGTPEASESVRLAFDTSYVLWYVFAAKVAGAFMAVFTTILSRLAQSATWMTVFGYVGALMLLFTIPHVEWLAARLPALGAPRLYPDPAGPHARDAERSGEARRRLTRTCSHRVTHRARTRSRRWST
jgi:hypothetical protein